MNHHATSRYLTHDFIVYQGLSLRELVCSGVFSMTLCTLLGFISGLILGSAFAGASLGLIAGFIVGIKVLPLFISRLKKGKPEGHLKKRVLLALAKHHLIASPFIRYQGVWRTKRYLGAPHV